MSAPGAYYVRKRDADFARLWDRAVARAGEARAAELAEAAAKAAGRRGLFRNYRQRHDGWTAIRTRIFLRALSETGCVRDACVRARISDTSAYRMRKRDTGFAAAWERALDRVAPTLEQAAFERAVEGWDEIVWRNGVEVSRKRRYSDSLLRLLLERGRPGQAAAGAGAGAGQGDLVGIAHAAARAAGGIFSTRASEEETNAAILKKLDMIDKARAMEAEDAAREAAAEAGAAEERLEADAEDRDYGAEDAAVPSCPPAAMPRITGWP